MLVELSRVPGFARINRVARAKEKPVKAPVEPHVAKDKKLAMQLLALNRNNAFPQNFSTNSKSEPISYRLGEYRFITHPVLVNQDGTYTFTIDRKSPNEDTPTAIEIVKDPSYPRDEAFYKLVFRGEVKKDGKKQWFHLKGEEAVPYAREFLLTMTPAQETLQEL